MSIEEDFQALSAELARVIRERDDVRARLAEAAEYLEALAESDVSDDARNGAYIALGKLGHGPLAATPEGSADDGK